MGEQFKSSVEKWTSFNRLHTENNIKCLEWMKQIYKNKKDLNFNERNIVVDFGCGTGETAAYLASMHRYGPCQVVGLDISLDFIKYAAQKFRKINNVVYFWSQYLEDLEFLEDKVSVVTCFTVLHLLSSDQINQVLVLHYLGRTNECFKIYLEIYLKLQANPKWRPYLLPNISQHRSLDLMTTELKIQCDDIITKFKKAYDEIPESMYEEFAQEFSRLFNLVSIAHNSQCAMLVFQKYQ